MLSDRLPALRTWIMARPFWAKLQAWRSAAVGLRSALGGWVKAQLKLTLLSFGIVTGGLLILGISYAPVWGALIAVVDAIPVLGTGTVLLPWAFVCLVQGNGLRALGLLITSLAAMGARSFLEPRLVGKQLGLDSLMTLVALYTGFRIWGVGGMLIAPLLCVAAGEVMKLRNAATGED
jgi:predicted PurR-regulated permease PerM